MVGFILKCVDGLEAYPLVCSDGAGVAAGDFRSYKVELAVEQRSVLLVKPIKDAGSPIAFSHADLPHHIILVLGDFLPIKIKAVEK